MGGKWLRHMNDKADRQATAGFAIDKDARRLESQWRANEDADRWAQEMLQRQYRGVRWVVENNGLEK